MFEPASVGAPLLNRCSATGEAAGWRPPSGLPHRRANHKKFFSQNHWKIRQSAVGFLNGKSVCRG